MINIYTDGGCTGNPGPGGWAAVIINGDKTVELSGGELETTNNRMELTAAIEVLKFLDLKDVRSGVIIHTDSEYVKNGITLWIRQWKLNGWKTAAKKDVKNKDLWSELDRLSEKREIIWQWVKGHSGVEFNERCDKLVAMERERLR